MEHLVLIGDSILDNGAYVAGGSPIVEQLRSRLPRDWRVTLLARDGAVAENVLNQIEQLPADVTCLVLSVGGNDALECSPILNMPEEDSSAMLAELVSAQNKFQHNYQQVMRALHKTKLPAIGCTIYDTIPGLTPLDRMGLSLFNDVIMRELITAHRPVLDLRILCNEPRDYSTISPIVKWTPFFGQKSGNFKFNLTLFFSQ